MAWLGLGIILVAAASIAGWLGISWLWYGMIKGVLALDGYNSASASAASGVLGLWLIGIYRGINIGIFVRAARADVSAVGCGGAALAVVGGVIQA